MKNTFAILLLVLASSPASAREFHVSLRGDNAHEGSPELPLRTISAAARLAQPGDTITVHEGVYRERIDPPRGGLSDAQRIVYRAAPGEKVEIKGSEVVTGWVKVQGDVWKVVLPNTFFGEFNPYSDLIRGDWFNSKGREHHTGAVYLNGQWLVEAASLEEILQPGSAAPPKPAKVKEGAYLVNIAWLRPGPATGEAARVPAASYAAQEGVKKAPCSEGGECLGWIDEGDWIRFDAVDFGQKTQQVEIRASSPGAGGQIELRLDSPNGELLGVCPVSGTGGWQTWASFAAKIKPVSGKKNLCLVVRRPATEVANEPKWFGQVDAQNTTLWAEFKGVDPNAQLVEINVRRAVFYPEKPGVNYITVRGFTMRHAAPPWAPPTAEQVGLIGTHWSKGWIIENNVISHSVCSGVALGKYGDEWDNKSQSADAYNETIRRALANGWSKENIGGHVVRNNTISHCEQAGVVGSLGAAFSTVTDNTIHDIHVRKLFSGAEMAGIKFHAAIDVQICRNHIYRTCRGLWLDWMAQGTRVSQNLFHDNQSQDLFVEVDHGPFLVDNNVFLSPMTLLSDSQGGAYVHNLIAGRLQSRPYDARQTPFHKAHSTEVAGLHDNPNGDDRYYNNLFVGRGDLSQYDNAKLPVWMEGNVFVGGAKPSRHERQPLLAADAAPVELTQKADGFYLQWNFDKAWAAGPARKLVTTELLGKAAIPNVLFEQPDGSPIRIDGDYFGKPRNASNPAPGPFENPGEGAVTLKVR